MAVPWLNAARYADTYGYQDDGEVSMWRWRDWVIEAFNANMPFDQFTIEQLAGDLLPNADVGTAHRDGIQPQSPRQCGRWRDSRRISHGVRRGPRRYDRDRLAGHDAQSAPAATITSTIR